MIDRLDVLVGLGVLLLGAAVWLWWGLAATLAFAGGVLLVAGLAVLVRRVMFSRENKPASTE